MEDLKRRLRDISPELRFESAVFAAWLIGFVIVNVFMVPKATFVTFLATDSLLVGFLYLALRSIQRVCFRGASSMRVVFKRFVLLVVGALILGVLLEVGTVFGDPLHSVRDLGNWSMRRIAIFACLSYCALALLWEEWPRVKGFKIKLSRTAVRWLLWSVPGVAIFTAALSSLLAMRYGVVPYAAVLLSICFGGCVAGLVMVCKFHPRVEAMFVVVALTLGFTIAVIYPGTTHLAMDDQAHYRTAVETSFLDEPTFTYADEVLIEREDHPEIWRVVLNSPRVPGDEAVDSEEVAEFNAILAAGCDQSASASSGLSSVAGSSVLIWSFNTVAYLPNAFGLWIGRFLHLPMHWIVVGGRLTGLLFYVFMSVLAIRIIPTKKVLLATVALLPTCVFTASSYSRDAWMIEFAFLGTALLMRILCGSKKIGCIDLAPVIVSFFMAIAIKPVYVPLLGLLLLVKRSRFVDKQQWMIFISAALAAILLLIMSFVLPFLLTGVGGNDMRGGSDVNSAVQLAYILSDPLGYVGTLGRTAVHYLDPAIAYSYALSFGNLGLLGSERFAFLASSPVFLYGAAALLDTDERSRALCNAWNRFIALIAFIVSLILVMTSMYVAFTSVGAPYINGVQGRYLLPILFPFLVFFLNVKIQNLMNEKAFAMFFVCATGLLGYLASFLFVVKPLVV